jgi:hypothetical protein
LWAHQDHLSQRQALLPEIRTRVRTMLKKRTFTAEKQTFSLRKKAFLCALCELSGECPKLRMNLGLRLDAPTGSAYNPFHHPGVVSAARPDSEGDARWKSPQGSSAEVARNTAEEIDARVERHGMVPLQAGRMMVRNESAFFHDPKRTGASEHEEGKERIEVVPRRHAFVLKRMRRVLF